MRFRTRGGAKERNISRNEATSEVPAEVIRIERADWDCNVPNNIPYASGQGPLEVEPSAAVMVGHVPSAYIASNIFEYKTH